MRQVTAFACTFAALYACAIAKWLYASLRANNATYAPHKAVTGRVEAKKAIKL